jgi:uncharacterized protein
MSLKGKWALVTGASSGIGVDFARQLAGLGASLVIVARRKDRLEALAAELRAANGVEVTVIDLDLSEASSAERLFAATEGAGRTIDILINNAGGGIHQTFLEIPLERTRQQIQVNLTSLVELTWRYARAMRQRGGGHILNVASIGAYTPSPFYATYSATKAFVRDFTEAVAYELADSPVRICSLCPGGVTTEFHQAAGHELPSIFRSTFMSSADCARIGLEGLFGGRRNLVSGLVNKLGMWLLRFMPRRTIVWLAALAMGRPKPVGG